MEKNILNKMAAETLSQMTANGDISDNFSPELKSKFLKVGVVTVMAGLLAISSGLAQAGDKNTRNTGLTLSALFGLATHGSKPADIPVDCNIQGTSGVKVGAGGAIGTLIGNQIGGGNGNKIATVAGGVIGAASMHSIEQDRMRNECAKRIATQRGNGHAIPTYATNSSSPQSPILYQGKTINGKTFYVTQRDSPGLAGLTGNVIGQLDIESDSIVKNAIDQGASALVSSYENLDVAAQKYLQISSGGTTVAKLARYAVHDNDVGANSHLNREYQQKLRIAKNEFNEAYSEYSRRRSVFANVADNAVIDGYNISGYGQVVPYFTPPESAALSFDGKMPNRYAIINTPIKP